MIEEQVINLISNVGFPIAAFCLMWYSHNQTLKKLTQAINELKECIKK